MSAICYHCGQTKSHPLQTCAVCSTTPYTEDEKVQSILLTDNYLASNGLASAAQAIRSGQGVTFPPGLRSSVLDSIRNANRRVLPVPQEKKSGLVKLLMGVVVLAILVCIFHPSPHYEWASFKDDIPNYELFLERFPHSHYDKKVNERLRVLRDDIVWAEASDPAKLLRLRSYVSVYPDGKHLTEAKIKIAEIADQEWAVIAMSRSEPDIRAFLAHYPETTKTAQAEARIQELHDDLSWVKERDSLPLYESFAKRFPTHPDIAWVKKRIIDLEVKAIAAGSYGDLPKSQPLSTGGSVVQVEVENQTAYELTVRYSGPESKKLVLAVGKTGKIDLPPGQYQVAASVNAISVTNYYGKETMAGGEYSSRFYIETR